MIELFINVFHVGYYFLQSSLGSNFVEDAMNNINYLNLISILGLLASGAWALYMFFTQKSNKLKERFHREEEKRQDHKDEVQDKRFSDLKEKFEEYIKKIDVRFETQNNKILSELRSINGKVDNIFERQIRSEERHDASKEKIRQNTSRLENNESRISELEQKVAVLIKK